MHKTFQDEFSQIDAVNNNLIYDSLRPLLRDYR